MNKFCVFAKNKETYFIKRLIEEVGDVKLFDPWSDLDLPVAETTIARTTGVYRSDLDLMMLRTLPPDSVVNSYEVLKRFRLKNNQYIWFEENDLPVLPWIPVKGTDLLTIEKFFRLYPELVVKPLAGQGGWGIEALKWDTFKSWKKKKGADEDYLLQPFVRDAVEYRYFFIKGQSPVVLERKAKSGIAANFRKEGEAKLTTFPAEYQATIDNVISRSGAHYGALDILVKDGELSILELNSAPGIEQVEKISGHNIIRTFVSSLTK